MDEIVKRFYLILGEDVHVEIVRSSFYLYLGERRVYKNVGEKGTETIVAAWKKELVDAVAGRQICLL